MFVKALPTYSIRDRKRCWPRIGRVAASKVTDGSLSDVSDVSRGPTRLGDTRIAATCKVVCCETTDAMCSCGGLFVFNGLYGLFFIWRSHGFTTSSQLFMLRASVGFLSTPSRWSSVRGCLVLCLKIEWSVGSRHVRVIHKLGAGLVCFGRRRVMRGAGATGIRAR